MQTVSQKTLNDEAASLFQPITNSNLAVRLARAVTGAARDFVRAPGGYLRIALFPDRASDWLPLSLNRKLGSAAADLVRHPLEFAASAASMNTEMVGYIYPPAGRAAAFATNAKAPDAKQTKRSYRWVLAASGAVHGALVVYLIYIAVASQFLGLRIVNEKYRKLDTDKILGTLYYPPGFFHSQITGPVKSLDQIREEERKRRDAAERVKREKEKAEKEKAEREKAAKEKAAQDVAEKGKDGKGGKDDDSKPASNEFGTINEAPIKDMLGKVYDLYKAGALDLKDTNFSLMAGFKIEKNGSLSHIRLIQSSGSKMIDKNALELLNMIGESHALAPISNLTSDTIRLDLTQDLARLTITGFAPTASDAKAQAQNLNFFLGIWRLAQKSKSPDSAELLSLLKVRSDNNRVDADLSVPRARANEMWHSKFGGPK